MKKIYYNKLVRDKIPDVIIGKGSSLETRKLESAEYETELLKKAAEEAGGLMSARNKQELAHELADLLAVIDEIKRHKKISTVDINTAKKANMKAKGSFSKKIFLVWSSDDGYQTNERRYGK
jgi:predicted house-cleaning noncanonical NTP pyrophosphatase (MazG superfamily)